MSGPVLTSVQGYQDRTVLGAVYPTESVTRVVSVDTRFRANPGNTNASDCTIRLPRTYKNVTSIRLSSAEIPNNWYEFSNNFGNTSFYVNGLPCTIPDGNYTEATLFTAIHETVLAVTTNAHGVDPLANSIVDLTVVFENITGKCRLDLSAGVGPSTFSIDFSPVLPPLCFACINCGSDAGVTCACGGCLRSSPLTRPFDTTLGSYLGFTSNAYINISSYTSENATNLLGSTYALLSLGNYDTLEHVSSNGTSMLGFAKIVSDAAKNTVIYANGNNTITNLVQFPEPENISSLKLKLMDAYGRVLPIFGNMSLTLELQEAVSSKLYTAYKDNLTGRR